MMYFNMFLTIYHDECLYVIARIQFRYGAHWAPTHTDEQGHYVFSEILLAPGEHLIQMDARTGWIIDAIVFTSNLHTYTGTGTSGDLYVSVPLNGLLYFSGASKDYYGVRPSKLAAHRAMCEAPYV